MTQRKTALSLGSWLCAVRLAIPHLCHGWFLVVCWVAPSLFLHPFLKYYHWLLKKTNKQTAFMSLSLWKVSGESPREPGRTLNTLSWRLEVPVLLGASKTPPENNSTTDLSASQGRAIANLGQYWSHYWWMSLWGAVIWAPGPQRFKVRLWTPWRVLVTSFRRPSRSKLFS